jgi:hypothetical protein
MTEEKLEVLEDTEQVQTDVDVQENLSVEDQIEEMSIEDLKKKRMGTFKVGMSYGDAVYYRNLLDKSEYTGPQQAYLLVVAKTEMSQICAALKDSDKASRHEVDLTSATIESIGFYMNRFTGKGADSAMKLFTSSMLLRPVMAEINKIDEIISEKSKSEQK